MITLANARLVGGSAEPVDLVLADGAVAQVRSVGSSVPSAHQRIDLEGRWVVPGLQDHHVHVNQWAMARRRFDVAAATSAVATAALAGAALASYDATSGLPLIGFGFRDGLWPDAPSRELLDERTGGVPTAIVAADLHSVWLNSAALERYGYSAHETGLLHENACFDVLRRLGSVPDAVLDAWVADSLKEAAGRGVTGITDMEMAWNVDPWRRREADGASPVRVRAAVYAQDLERAITDGWATGMPVTDSGVVTFGPLKVISDGSLNTRTAFCFEPYRSGPSGNVGVANLSADELRTSMRRAARAGIACAVHAIGDRANTEVIDAFAATGARGTIEHAQLVRAADVARLAQLGLAASIQPQHAVDDRAVTDVYWADRVADAFRMRSLLHAGVPLLFGSDAPVAPLDPWLAMAAAVTRANPGESAWHPEEALSVSEALAASTATGRITVQPGDPADLAVLDCDPLALSGEALSGEALRTVPVAATVVAGRVVSGGAAEWRS